jgi:uncharacterized protein
MKYLIWFVICLAVVVWIKRKKAALSDMRGNTQGMHADMHGAASAPNVETMQQCAHCGMYIPASEAVMNGNGAIFCCAEHRTQHAAR